ncbi:hypothetical protein M0R72_13485 [Candidatus Pacearchaeota archaeon]|jgi:hypothetical protein|nr:hypothetical protein [Candidatus Pacearchaeota archaeon]
MAADSPVEDILYDLKAWLASKVPTNLRAIETERADGMVLADPVLYEVSDADPWGHATYPVVLIYPTEAPVLSDADSGHDEIQLAAEILVAISDGSPSEGTKRILRYIEAIRETIRDDRTMTAQVDLISTTRMIYYPTDPDSAGIRIATIGVDIRKLLDRY